MVKAFLAPLASAFAFVWGAALADGGATKPSMPNAPAQEAAPRGSAPAKNDEGRTKAAPTNLGALPTTRIKSWNEMTRAEQDAARRAWVHRPKKWDEMTPAEQDAARRAWLFSTGD